MRQKLNTIMHLPHKKVPYILKFKDKWSGRHIIKAFHTEEEAQNYLDTVSKEYSAETLLLQTARKTRTASIRLQKSLTVGNLLLAYTDHLKSSSTRSSTTNHIRTLIDMFGERKACRITKADVDVFRQISLKREVSETTINSRLRILRTAYNWAVSNELLEKSPLASLNLPTPRTQVPEPPSEEELRQIYKAAVEHIRRIVVLGSTTGCRVGPSEMFKIRWVDVDWTNKMLRVVNAHKGAKSEYRMVPISNELLKHLKKWKFEDMKSGYENGTIINYYGKAVTSANHAWRATLQRAGITRRIRLYDLRHCWISRALEAGADLKTVSELAGHANPTMVLKVYQHISPAGRRKAIDLVPTVGFGCKHTPRTRRSRMAYEPNTSWMPIFTMGSTVNPWLLQSLQYNDNLHGGIDYGS